MCGSPTGDNPVQRGYTPVDPGHDAFGIEFALHAGPAWQWARAAAGNVVDATVMGSKYAVPQAIPPEFTIFGDTAAPPEINSLLDPSARRRPRSGWSGSTNRILNHPYAPARGPR